MSLVVRWSRSSYETDADLDLEREGAARAGFEYVVEEARGRPPERLGDADVLVCTSRVRVDAQLLEGFGGTHVVTTTSGVDHIDLEAAAARGIVVGRSPLARRDAVVEHALGGLIGMMRRVPRLNSDARRGRWSRAALPDLAPRRIAGARIVVVGLGVIGSRMAEVLEGLGAQVLAVDPYVHSARWPLMRIEEALADADAVTLHCALTPSSRGLLDATRLDLLPRHAVVVNTARGESLDVAAAVQRVRAGLLRGLVVDVFPAEPHPRLAEDAIEGVWLSPHSAGFSHDLGERVAEGIVRSLEAIAEGRRLPFPVEPSPRA